MKPNDILCKILTRFANNDKINLRVKVYFARRECDGNGKAGMAGKRT